MRSYLPQHVLQASGHMHDCTGPQAASVVATLAEAGRHLLQLICVCTVVAVGVDVGVDCPLLSAFACVQDEVRCQQHVVRELVSLDMPHSIVTSFPILMAVIKQELQLTASSFEKS